MLSIHLTSEADQSILYSKERIILDYEQADLLKPYEMTYNQYCSHWLEHCKYIKSYVDNPNLWNAKKRDLLIEWKNVLLERARVFPLPSKVLVSYIREFGEADLFRTFRGIYEQGIRNFRIPKRTRDLMK